MDYFYKISGDTSFYCREREQTPRFCQVGSFEYEYGLKWKELYQRQREEEELLKRQFEESVGKMEMEMANAYMEHQTAMLRQGQILSSTTYTP